MLNKAYQHCLDIAANHYENFPVASRLLGKSARQSVAAVYAFARFADDLADEGDLSPQERLDQLQHLETGLDNLSKVQDDLMLIALQDTISKYQIPRQLFKDLLYAFKQDVTQNTYQDWPELLNYCKYSAEPIGQILLLIHQQGQGFESHSNLICTCLQLLNFLQDISSDARERKRYYLPMAEMAKFGLSLEDLAEERKDQAVLALNLKLLEKIEGMLLTGSLLGLKLKGLFGLEIRLVISAAFHLLQKLKQRQSPWQRPLIGKKDALPIVWRAIRFRSWHQKFSIAAASSSNPNVERN